MFTPTDFYLLRIPHFSFIQLLALNKAIENKDINAVKEIFKKEEFLGAIFLSSRYFYEVAVSWINDTTIKYDHNDRVFKSLYKYYTRICTRCTPYGAFAGFALGEISDASSQIVFSENIFTHIYRVDLLFLKKIKDSLLLEHKSNEIIYFPNNTLYRIGENFRYIEWDDDYNYEISEVKTDAILNGIINNAKNGINKSELKSYIKKSIHDTKGNEVLDYIDDLINSKILVDDLPPHLTSLNDPLKDLDRNLAQIQIDTKIIKPLIKFQDNQNKNFSISQLKSICRNYNKIIGEKSQPFQVDMKANFDTNNIATKVVDEISKTAFELSVLASNEPIERITKFCKDFNRKFEGKEVSLTQALDPQIGVGYGLRVSGNVEDTPLVKDIYFTYKNKVNKILVPPIIQIILEKYLDCFKLSESKSIVLQETDIKNATIQRKSLNPHEDYYLFGNLYTSSFTKLDNLDFKFLPKSPLPTPFANNILSRFSYHDKNLRKKIKSIIKIKNDDKIYAEIIHHPSDRIGNILLRPNIYNHEIQYVTKNKSDKIRININDILVKIESNRIVLKSKSLNKEISPRLSTAYNYSINQLSIIKFLGDLQYHNKYNGFNWDWSILKNRSFLPRVEYKHIILSEARWLFKSIKGETLDDLRKRLKKNEVPRYCNIKDADNVLLLDIENEICLSLIKKRLVKKDIHLYEAFIKELFISRKQMKYMAEFIFPVLWNPSEKTNKKPPVRTEEKVLLVDEELTIHRNYNPGEEWSYFKIYCSHLFGDKVIKKVIGSILRYFHNRDTDLNWFFIRYEDPQPHIRFRIKKKLDEEILYELNRLLKIFIKEGSVSSLQIETYKREIERYGANNMELSEQVFYFDSKAILNFLNIYDEQVDEDLRWQISFVSIDLLLDDFKLPLIDRISLFESLYEIFLPEFVDTSNKKYIRFFKDSANKKYIANKSFLDSVLRLKDYQELYRYIEPFSRRSDDIRNIVDSIKGNLNDTSELIKLLQSYIHMNLNRLFFAKARMHELVIYYLILRTYKSIFYRNEAEK